MTCLRRWLGDVLMELGFSIGDGWRRYRAADRVFYERVPR